MGRSESFAYISRACGVRRTQLSACESKTAQSTEVGDRSEKNTMQKYKYKRCAKVVVVQQRRKSGKLCGICHMLKSAGLRTGSSSLHWLPEATGSAMAMAALMTFSRLLVDYLDMQIHRKERR